MKIPPVLPTPMIGRRLTVVGAMWAMTCLGGPLVLYGQSPTATVTAADRLRQVLPADVAQRILAQIATAQTNGLPGHALEQRALKFAAKGVAPSAIETAIAEQARRMAHAKTALDVPGRRSSGDEIDAAADAMRRGVGAPQVKALATQTPSGRSLAVPLYVVGSLIDRGLPADSALRRVRERLQARASDSDLEKLPATLPPQAKADQAPRSDKIDQGNGKEKEQEKVKERGRPSGDGPGAGRRPAGVNERPGVRPTGVPVNPPSNAGKGKGRGKGGKPATPPGHL